MINSNLLDYSDAYIHVAGTITNTFPNTGTAAAPDNRNKKVIFKDCAPFISCISEIYNTKVDDAHGIYVVMPMYNLIENSDAYSKTSGNFWQYYRDEPALDNNKNLLIFLLIKIIVFPSNLKKK